MSDKPYSELSAIEQRIERTYPAKMSDKTMFTLKRIVGFELFNTRPYHNYETWSTGFVVEDEYGNRASAEDMNECLMRLCDKRDAQVAAMEQGK